jgi:hypothetical protein
MYLTSILLSKVNAASFILLNLPKFVILFLSKAINPDGRLLSSTLEILGYFL